MNEQCAVQPQLTLDQAELCKAALLTAPLKGTLPEMIQVVARFHATIKAIDEALEAARKDAHRVEGSHAMDDPDISE